ncbi:adenylate/guanylate cyclase domain-containing protein [Lichenihabitans sp. Uapishka_5]|uniref:adenylate/guanylate cyclase domain-containing protein n=1 Tax=Lichenihabitans sp. Uapishka_5 TaxID=3037302 RepID=UPI0029E821FB|nr:adenylate/guanylate cyclase domain-containing protein [Lichenihabitans sp. Uapishka_5]MDX7952647.1 adenylate/guanylate cyclase domain-containing protein [Lichenihabitans sp. Uapishka_5]
MTPSDLDAIRGWVTARGLAGASETELVEGFCQRCRAAGLELSRGAVLIDTLHPVYEGRIFRWREDGTEQQPMLEYGRTGEGGEQAENWQRSVHFHLLDTGGDEFCCHLGRETFDFFTYDTMRGDGVVGVAAFVHRFAQEGSFGDMDCVYSSWTTHHPEGFGEAQMATLRQLLPSLALAVKCRSLARVAATLVEVYLGRDAGKRVLSGRIARGVAERMTTVLWFSDLRGYTTITDTAAPEEIIPLLNDYSAAAIEAIHGHGGDVLKLMGDGVLAIFRAEDHSHAVGCALKAVADLKAAKIALNQRRQAEGRPVTSIYLGLHIGEVLFGNIGSEERLDFTVVGPAVNEVSRIASMCRSVDRAVVISSAFAEAAEPAERDRMVSLGRFALRGVGRAQELFTLDPER